MIRDKFVRVISYLGAALALLIPAFINGYPLVYSDTSTYLASGFELETPFDRPITYGLFIRFFSFNGYSLWTVLLAQSGILAFLVIQLTKHVLLNNSLYPILGFVICIFLSLFSSVSWTASQIMPDIFTAIMFLSIVLLLEDDASRKKRYFLYFIFLISCAMHMSHVTIIFVYLPILFLFKKFLQPFHFKYKSILYLGLLTVASLLTMGSALSKSKHVFLMGAFVEHGIIEKYLDENCKFKTYQLCAYKDSLPEKAWQFVWDETSPLYKLGTWGDSKEEFNSIIWNTFTQRKYIIEHIYASVLATMDQLTQFQIGDGNKPYTEETVLYQRIQKYVPSELHSYASSKQNKDELGFMTWFNHLQLAIVCISLVCLIFFIILKENSLNKIKLYLVSAVFINAWACGTFANAIDRLGSKMIWIFPLLVILILLRIFNERHQLLKANNE
ncbi:MAG: hypothetical protein IPM92_04440 [Saprospiraceae bacterium]|nr:hypothetical protein [Saprospiraceae bacterium]